MTLDPNARINLTKAAILVVESSQHALDTMVQILRGFEAREIFRALTVAEANEVLATKSPDLVLLDPSIEDDSGFACIRALRASGREPNSSVPIIALCGHPTPREVARCRDTGANFVIAKPITAAALLQRIQWVTIDKRQFVAVGNYVGPDRRFKFEGPPAGTAGQRSEDEHVSIGDAKEPNLSQSDIDALLKPQKVVL